MSGGRTPDLGAGQSFNVTVGAGLYEFLRRHSLRAVLGKNPGEVAASLILDQAKIYDRDNFLGIKLPAEDFPAPPKA
jgi:hypothetical protein